MKACKIRLQVTQLFLLMMLAVSATAQLKADFTASQVSGCPPLIVNFRDSSTGNPTSWKWDLGNGTQSVMPNPMGTYFDPGTYTVKLVVRNAANDADSLVRTQYIVVHALPVPQFSVSDTSGCFPLSVQFSDKSSSNSGTVSTWQWDFGDGNLSTQQNPDHTYNTAGAFTVILRVTNSNGCSGVITKPSLIKTSPGVKANFSFTAPSSCNPPTPVSFTSSSTGPGVLSHTWQFGDGNTSTAINPVYSYSTPGVYSVKLIVTSANGCSDTIVRSNIINIGTVKANFTSPDSVCAGAVVSFTNTSAPSTISAVWSFSDGTTSALESPQKIFSTPGTYQVKMVNNFGTCLDSITKTIVVLDKPTANFLADTTTSCKFPFTVQFTQSATGASKYYWTFGDGSSSTQANPVHSYNRNGNFTVTLIVTNGSGCSDTLRKSSYIRVTPPRISSINNLNVKGCIPFIVNPVANITTSQPITSYFWDFGDGGTSTDATPMHVYTKPGIFNVKLVVTTASGCKDSLRMNSAVAVGHKPTASFTAAPQVVCSFTPVVFSDSSSGNPIHTWYWDFHDGSTSTLQKPEHQFGDTGRFDVSLVVTSFGCADTLLRPDYIQVLPPVADFDVEMNCAEPLKRIFTDDSRSPQSWLWQFGDSTTSSDSSPVHIYAKPGNYKVRLTVTNGACEHFKEMDVVVVDEKATLTISGAEACRNTRTTFTVGNILPANIASYTWYFYGIGNEAVTTTDPVVAHTYTTPGTYAAAVVVTDINACNDTLYTNVPIKVYGPQPEFVINPAGTCLGSPVQFTDSTRTDGIHPIVKWQWQYGDSIVQDFTVPTSTHTYAAEGVYNVKLVIEDNFGCTDSITKISAVHVSKPIAGFTVSDTAVCPASTISFTNTSTGRFNLTYQWHFGDGNTSADINPAHAYSAPGFYTVKLVITDKFGCTDSMQRSIAVNYPVAAFAMSDTFSSCPPLVVNFTNQSAHYVQLNWDFGDGGNSQLINPSRIYTYPGVYNITLSVINNGGCADTITKTIVIQGPTGSFQYSPVTLCAGNQVAFGVNTSNSIKYIWDFDDGNTLFNTESTAAHIFNTPGKYIPKVILEDAAGCKVPIVGSDTINVLGVETYLKAQQRLLCDSGMVAFSDSTISNDAISGYYWNFGDSTTSSAKDPVHHYQKEGWYTVTLITTSAFGCADTAVYNDHIKIVRSPLATIIGDTAACEPAMLTFSGGKPATDTSVITWNWNFGNGNVATGQTPGVQQYATAGSYPVRLVATNSDGCVTVVHTTAVAHPIPVVDAGMDTTICRFDSYTLTATGAHTYLWTSHSSLSDTTNASVIATPVSRQTYYVTGTSIHGCVNSDSVVLQVKQPFTISVTGPDSLCMGQSKQLLATGAEIYSWTPGAGLDNPGIADPKARPDNTTTYMVVGSDDHNCFTDTGYVTLTVFPIPTISILNGDAITIPVGSKLKLNTLSSPDVTSWRWTTSRWLSCVTCPEPEAQPKQNISYAVVASNNGNCVARDEIEVNLICTDANIYIPNTFSPNGDGMNDVFFPRGTGLYNIKSMRVFNRWGQLVFEKTNITPNNHTHGWNGKVNSVDMQPDVYVYIIEAICDNNTVVPIKGNVTLLR